MKNDDPHIWVEGPLTSLLLAEFANTDWRERTQDWTAWPQGQKGEAEMRQGRQTAAYEEAPTIEVKKPRREMSRAPSGS